MIRNTNTKFLVRCYLLFSTCLSVVLCCWSVNSGAGVWWYKCKYLYHDKVIIIIDMSYTLSHRDIVSCNFTHTSYHFTLWNMYILVCHSVKNESYNLTLWNIWIFQNSKTKGEKKKPWLNPRGNIKSFNPFHSLHYVLLSVVISCLKSPQVGRNFK